MMSNDVKITPGIRHVLEMIAADKSPYDLAARNSAWITLALTKSRRMGLWHFSYGGRRSLTDAGRAALENLQ